MDKAAAIYASILNSMHSSLSKVNPQLAGKALSDSFRVLDGAGIGYRVKREGLEIHNAKADQRPAMYRSLLAYANPFEEEYGINNTWSPMRRVIINLIQGIRDSIRELSIEVPIARYDLTHTIYNNLVEFNSKGFRKVKWTEMPVTITNKRLIFGQKGKPFDVPLNSIATVGREIYMVYTGSINKGILKAIDFKLRETGMSCAVAVAKEDIMEDFIRTVKVMRNEWRKLSPIEARILTAIYHDANPGDLAKVAKCEKEMAELGYQRLLELRYIDETGRITSFGINTAEQYIKS